jgi:hypothetical protein
MIVWRYTSTILDLSTRWRLTVRFTLLPLYLRRTSPRYQLYRRLGGFQDRSEQYAEEKNILPLLGIEPQL